MAPAVRRGPPTHPLREYEKYARPSAAGLECEPGLVGSGLRALYAAAWEQFRRCEYLPAHGTDRNLSEESFHGRRDKIPPGRLLAGFHRWHADILHGISQSFVRHVWRRV